jgi:hypothetical protein
MDEVRKENHAAKNGRDNANGDDAGFVRPAELPGTRMSTHAHAESRGIPTGWRISVQKHSGCHDRQLGPEAEPPRASRA